MSTPPSTPRPGGPIPAELAKLLHDAGGKVAIVGNGPATMIRDKSHRFCTNCGFNPTGNGCQREPLRMTAVPEQQVVEQQVPDPANPGQFMTVQVPEIGIKWIVEPRPAPPNYCCGEHRFEEEMFIDTPDGKKPWRFVNKPPAANS